MQREEIIHYYDTCESDYRLFWDLDQSLAMHAGYWDSQTKTLRDALRRENEVLAEWGEVQKRDRVLDAGCGVGGSSIFLAQHYQCEVVGITLSEKQAKRASQEAERVHVSPQLSFLVMDYTCTTFPSESFDVVWAIESVCHVEDKRLFIQEAFRLLKPGGRLIVADGFAWKPAHSEKEHHQMKSWLKGWGVTSLDTSQHFQACLEQIGFEEIKFKDITSHVLPSSKKLYVYSWLTLSLSKLAELIGWRTRTQTENLYSARCQYATLKKGLWQYGVFLAKKSKIAKRND